MTSPTEKLIKEAMQEHLFLTFLTLPADRITEEVLGVLKNLIKTKQIRITKWKLNRKAG